jgi:hypothetical protein
MDLNPSFCISTFQLSFKKRHTVSDSWITRLQINLIALYFFFIGPTVTLIIIVKI